MKITKFSCIFASIALGIATATIATSFVPAHGEDNNDYIPEIGWSSRISSMGLDREDNLDKKYKFNCQSAPEDLVHAPTWGTTVYTANSGICSAAVHSGMVEPEAGGEITIKLIEGKQFYTGSNKNEVKSKDHTATEICFTFVGEKKVAARQQDTDSENKKREPSGIERVLMEGFQRGVERTIEKAITDILD